MPMLDTYTAASAMLDKDKFLTTNLYQLYKLVIDSNLVNFYSTLYFMYGPYKETIIAIMTHNLPILLVCIPYISWPY